MTAPSITLTEQMLRRRPVIGAPVAHGASDHLKRTIGTFQLTMFGVGATVGTGIFFVLSVAVPRPGPAVVVSFIDRRASPPVWRPSATPNWPRRCRFRVRRTPTPTQPSASSWPWAWPPVCCWSTACRSPRWQWAGAATSTNCWTTCSAVQIPHALTAAPWDSDPGLVNLPAIVLIVMCALLLIRGASESAAVNTVMVVIKLGVLAMFAIIAFTAFQADRFADSRRSASRASARRPARSSSPTSDWMPSRPQATRSRTRSARCPRRSSPHC